MECRSDIEGEEMKRTYGPPYAPVSENKSRCIKSVADGGRSVTAHQCHRQRGFGPNGEYCKQHSPQTDVIRRAWLAEYKFNEPDMIEVEILRETTATIEMRPVGESVFDNYIYTGRKSKKVLNLFDTKEEAFGFLAFECELKIARSVDETKALREQYKEIIEKSRE